MVLVVSALTSSDSEVHERRFQRGKEILALLLGVFGTIVGFYFGSEVSHGAESAGAAVVVAPLHLDTQLASPGGSVRFTTLVTGGRPPYRFEAGLGSEPAQVKGDVGPDGYIDQTIALPKKIADSSVQLHVVVLDSAGTETETSSTFAVKLTQ